MTKRFHAGRASQSGVLAAYLAQQDFTGSLDAIEAPFRGCVDDAPPPMGCRHDLG